VVVRHRHHDHVGRLLEQRVQRAIELIERLRADNAGLTERIETLTAEAAALRQREQAAARAEAEVRRLQDERQTLLGQVEGMLKELARIDG
jgi:FtsZ-binding cell division protein ZapB